MQTPIVSESKVIVKIAGWPDWERSHDDSGNPSGVSMNNAAYLQNVVAVLEESLNQAKANHDLMKLKA